jgi:hypothetical protein
MKDCYWKWARAVELSALVTVTCLTGILAYTSRKLLDVSRRIEEQDEACFSSTLSRIRSQYGCGELEGTRAISSDTEFPVRWDYNPYFMAGVPDGYIFLVD